MPPLADGGKYFLPYSGMNEESSVERRIEKRKERKKEKSELVVHCNQLICVTSKTTTRRHVVKIY